MIKGNEKQAWENLLFKLGLTDAHHYDEFDARNELSYTWSNKRETELLYARFDKAYVGDWARDRGRKIRIMEGMSTLSDHLLVLTTIRKLNHNEELDRSFKFNLSFLEDVLIKNQIINAWQESPRPSGPQGWMRWVADASGRIKKLCQQIGKDRARERRERIQQLRATLASAERLL